MNQNLSTKLIYVSLQKFLQFLFSSIQLISNRLLQRCYNEQMTRTRRRHGVVVMAHVTADSYSFSFSFSFRENRINC